jgi:succinoglycan biosynthesis protein ExoW
MSVTDETHAAGRAHVAVIIPFFQRRPGILARALESALCQTGPFDLSVVVVDDASPVPAVDEVEALAPELRPRVTVLRQANAGPGAARNRGLDALGTDVDCVAFLDSDDQWRPGHVARAVRVLTDGCDLFFSNYRDIGRDVSGFDERGHIDPGAHDLLDSAEGLYGYRGDLRDAVLTGCPIETSTVIFRRAAFADLRFREEFRNAYEDYMFWFEMAAAMPRVAFSTEVATQYGEGVNLYRGAAADSDAAFRVLVGSTRFGAAVRRRFALSPPQRRSIAERLDRNRRAVTAQLMHRLRRFQPLPWRDLGQYLAADPASWYRLPASLVAASVRWAAGRGEDHG